MVVKLILFDHNHSTCNKFLIFNRHGTTIPKTYPFNQKTKQPHNEHLFTPSFICMDSVWNKRVCYTHCNHCCNEKYDFPNGIIKIHKFDVLTYVCTCNIDEHETCNSFIKLNYSKLASIEFGSIGKENLLFCIKWMKTSRSRSGLGWYFLRERKQYENFQKLTRIC